MSKEVEYLIKGSVKGENPDYALAGPYPKGHHDEERLNAAKKTGFRLATKDELIKAGVIAQETAKKSSTKTTDA